MLGEQLFDALIQAATQNGIALGSGLFADPIDFVVSDQAAPKSIARVERAAHHRIGIWVICHPRADHQLDVFTRKLTALSRSLDREPGLGNSREKRVGITR